MLSSVSSPRHNQPSSVHETREQQLYRCADAQHAKLIRYMGHWCWTFNTALCAMSVLSMVYGMQLAQQLSAAGCGLLCAPAYVIHVWC